MCTPFRSRGVYQTCNRHSTVSSAGVLVPVRRFDYLEVVVDGYKFVLSCQTTQSGMSSTSEHWYVAIHSQDACNAPPDCRAFHALLQPTSPFAVGALTCVPCVGASTHTGQGGRRWLQRRHRQPHLRHRTHGVSAVMSDVGGGGLGGGRASYRAACPRGFFSSKCYLVLRPWAMAPQIHKRTAHPRPRCRGKGCGGVTMPACRVRVCAV